MLDTELESTIRRNPRVVFRQLTDGTGVLLNLDSTHYHGVDNVGALIWSLLDGPRTVGALVSELRSQLTDPPAHVTEDVQAFVADLKDRDLVTAGT